MSMPLNSCEEKSVDFCTRARRSLICFSPEPYFLRQCTKGTEELKLTSGAGSEESQNKLGEDAEHPEAIMTHPKP